MSNSVSVILPYFNRADTLRAAAASVLRQSHSDLRLLMVNDGSTDGSRSIVATLDDERVVHIDLAANSGPSAARNAGLAAAPTDLVAFMDSDDDWLDRKLEYQVRTLRTHQSAGEPLAVVGCGWRLSHDDPSDRIFSGGPFDRRDMLRGVRGTGTPMLLVDRAVAASGATFDKRLPSLEERDYVLSCLANGSLLRVLPEQLVRVTRGRSDHVANAERTAAAWELLIDKYAVDLGVDEELRSWYHFRAARELLIAGRRQCAASHVSRALRRQTTRRAMHIAFGWLGGMRGIAVAQKILPLSN